MEVTLYLAQLQAREGAVVTDCLHLLLRQMEQMAALVAAGTVLVQAAGEMEIHHLQHHHKATMAALVLRQRQTMEAVVAAVLLL
jgi:hypothetical protein